MTKNSHDQRKATSFTFSNIASVAIAVFVIAMFFSPDLKGKVIQGMMVIGLFQPDVSDKPITKNTTSSIDDAAFKNQDGVVIQLSDLQGKVVFLNFWASWCPPCIAEMPSIDHLHTKYKDRKDVIFLMVDVDGKIESSKEFMRKRNLKLPVYIPASATPVAYFSGSLPTTVILNKTGNVVFQHIGAADYTSSKISTLIDQLLL